MLRPHLLGALAGIVVYPAPLSEAAGLRAVAADSSIGSSRAACLQACPTAFVQSTSTLRTVIGVQTRRCRRKQTLESGTCGHACR